MKKKYWVFLTLGLILLGFATWVIWSNRAIEANEYFVESETLPAAFNGFRIAQVSDLHSCEFGKNNGRLLRLLEESKADIIVITGDLIDSGRMDVESAVDFITQAGKIAPIYYVVGNHESRIPEAYFRLEREMISQGVHVLHNEDAILERGGEKIRIVGIDDYFFFEKHADFLEKLESMSKDELYTVLLCHRPEYFSFYVEYGYELVFCGHAHGGQVRVPGVGGLYAPDQGFFPEYDWGCYTEEECNMVVSRGLGNSRFRPRINNRPELVIVELGCQY